MTVARFMALAGLLLLSACGGVPFPRVEPISDEAKRVALTAALVHPLGPTKMHQRAIVRHGAEETNLTLYVRLRPPDEVHLAAIGDLGGTAFEAKRDAGGVEVVRSSPLLPDRVVRALVEGEALAFLAPQRGPLRLVRLERGEPALHGGEASGRELLLWSDARGDRLFGGEGGRLLMRAQVSWGAGRPAGAPMRPYALHLEGATAEFEASIVVLRCDPLADAAPPRAGGR